MDRAPSSLVLRPRKNGAYLLILGTLVLQVIFASTLLAKDTPVLPNRIMENPKPVYLF